MKRKPLVYIAGPYRRPDPVINTNYAVSIGRELRDGLGIVDLVPHLSLFEHFLEPNEYEQYWLAVTMDRLRCCDAMFRLPGESSGSDAEEAEANRLGIPVFYSKAKLAEWVKQFREQHGTVIGNNQAGENDAQGTENGREASV